VKVTLTESYSAHQTDFLDAVRPTSFLTDAALTWEPLDKRIQLALRVQNVFATDNTPRYSLGRIVSASLAFRF
jgi:outer membrane receptor protein involved in Fe transport